MREYNLAVIPGDGIGREVIPAGLRVLEALERRQGDFRLHPTGFPWGSDFYRRTGRMMPDGGLKQLRDFDAILFGAVGDPDLPDDLTLWELRLRICQGLDQYANVRPARILPGLVSPLRDVGPDDLDWVIVRENSEGEYSGQGGRTHRGLADEIGTETAIFTRRGIERIMRFAFGLARLRPRKHVTVVTKSNAQRHGMVLWDEVAEAVAENFPDVSHDKMLVDAMTVRMVGRPRSIDVVVATNLHADILSDLAAALAGSIGVAPTANLDPEGRFPSMFEPIHGAAFDIAGRGIANPLGTFWSAAMMLDHIGEPAGARRLMSAIESVTRAGDVLTPDLGGRATTAEVTDAVIAAIRGANE